MLSPQFIPLLVALAVLLQAGHAQRACEGPRGPPGRDGLHGPAGPQGKPGLPASQDAKLQNDLKELKHRITRLERALSLNGKIVLAGSKLFATTEKTADFDETVRLCRAAHGKIASPMDKDENDVIMSFVQQFDSYAYLGITEGQVPGKFHFLNGTPLNFTNWYRDEPSGKGTEKCVEMYTDGTWNDKQCDKFRLTVCEF